MKGKVCLSYLPVNKSRNEVRLQEGIWKIVNGLCSLYEMPEAGSQGGYLSGVY